jgi:hypothetical protein
MRWSRPWQLGGAIALSFVAACAHEVQDFPHGFDADDGDALDDNGPGDDFAPTTGGNATPAGSGGRTSPSSVKPSGGSGATGGADSASNGGADGAGGKSSSSKGGGRSRGGAAGEGGEGGRATTGGGGSGPVPPTHQACKSVKLPIESGESSSNEDPSLGPMFAFDGVETTRWSSAHSEPQWLAVDLGEVVRISRVLIRWEKAYAADYQVAVADQDDGPWEPLFRDREGDGETDDVDDFDAATGRYLRMTGTKRATVFGFSILELELYGDADEACIAK